MSKRILKLLFSRPISPLEEIQKRKKRRVFLSIFLFFIRPAELTSAGRHTRQGSVTFLLLQGAGEAGGAARGCAASFSLSLFFRVPDRTRRKKLEPLAGTRWRRFFFPPLPLLPTCRRTLGRDGMAAFRAAPCWSRLPPLPYFLLSGALSANLGITVSVKRNEESRLTPRARAFSPRQR